MLKAVFFDLDGTLLPNRETEFANVYFSLLAETVAPYGYDPKKLIENIWAGTKKMIANDGKKTNYDVFWDYFKTIYGEEKARDIALFDRFYANEFKGTKAVCGENPLAKKIVRECRKKAGKVALTTNPLFPLQGNLTRMAFVGLEKTDFDLITCYENSHFCKPNPKYFTEVLEKMNLRPEEVVLFGNNTLEDGACADAAGIRCYLVGDLIIRSPETDRTFPEIQMGDILKVVDELL